MGYAAIDRAVMARPPRQRIVLWWLYNTVWISAGFALLFLPLVLGDQHGLYVVLITAVSAIRVVVTWAEWRRRQSEKADR